MFDEKQKGVWEALVKDFPQGAYSKVKYGRGFVTIDAYHIVERLTEVFGLCGIGWGVEDVNFVINGDNVAAVGWFWYKLEEKNRVFAVGDSQVIKGNIAEAYKKALTNLISKASSYIGVGLPVYKGLILDDPYKDRENMKNDIGNEKIVEMDKLEKKEMSLEEQQKDAYEYVKAYEEYLKKKLPKEKIDTLLDKLQRAAYSREEYIKIKDWIVKTIDKIKLEMDT